eukprot:TRINITY_DN67640_c7_g3_i1.p1 TRINITY_DN67640_c7_g3~~TRINITY_DN67640_c7_g3_i1.p1  ORF type:complete len:583 (+),score=62.79 TRINITY_DN67640_c7_g3_i1:193-1941(+)
MVTINGKYWFILSILIVGMAFFVYPVLFNPRMHHTKSVTPLRVSASTAGLTGISDGRRRTTKRKSHGYTKKSVLLQVQTETATFPTGTTASNANEQLAGLPRTKTTTTKARTTHSHSGKGSGKTQKLSISDTADKCPKAPKQLDWDRSKRHPCKFISPRKHGLREKWLKAIKQNPQLDYTGHLIYSSLSKTQISKLYKQHCLMGVSYDLMKDPGWNSTRRKIMAGWVDGFGVMGSKSQMVLMMRKWGAARHCSLDATGIVPIQFMTKLPTDCHKFISSYVHPKKGHKKPRKVAEWITKSAGGTYGQGIHFYSDTSFAKGWQCDNPDKHPKDTVVQELLKPYLLEGHKCHFRFYLLIGSTDPWMIFWYPGMASCSGAMYDHQKAFKTGNGVKRMLLTNTYQQRVNASAAKLYTIDEVGDLMESTGKMTKAQWWKKYRNYGHWLSQWLVLSAKKHLKARPASFHNFAIDVMMSDDGRLNFLEVNVAAGAKLLMTQALPNALLKLTLKIYQGELNPHKMPYGDTGIGGWELVWSQTWGVPWVHPESDLPPCACGQTEGCTNDYKAPPLCTPLSTEAPDYPENAGW